ncbi:MAG: hypothetical protein NVSMB44_08550 [Ktedonobacteraceae bacterium]
MATEERLPPACAFAISVLAERDQDPDAVPEEAVEAAQHHMVTCARCVASQIAQAQAESTASRKKKKMRRVFFDSNETQSTAQALLEERPSLVATNEQAGNTLASAPRQDTQRSLTVSPPQSSNEAGTQEIAVATASVESVGGTLDCQQCRQFLAEYADALDAGQPVAVLYPEVYEHLLHCDTGCLVLLDLFKQEAKANRKYKRRPVRDPFSAIGWELSGFFRAGQVPMSTQALAYGTLILLLLVASLSAFLGFNWSESRYHTPPTIVHPTPDGPGFSDGLKVFDACNGSAYQAKRDAARQMSQAAPSKADGLLTSALRTTQGDGSGCNAGEAAVYQEDLHVRQSGHPFGVVVVSFDSTAGDADPAGGSDRHHLYAAGTQELIGVSITQKQYNTAQMETPEAPLLYLVLANTTGTASGAGQVATMLASLAGDANYSQFGLLIDNTHPLLAVLGLGPSALIQDILPGMCRAGVPIIAPTISATSLSGQLEQVSLYNHCAPGFGFVRLAADDKLQGVLGANFAYIRLKAKNAALIYNPGDSSSETLVQSFSDHFSQNVDTHIVAQETTVAGDATGKDSGQVQRAHESIAAALNDAMRAKTRPDVIFAAVQTVDAYALAQAIAHLPQNQQPALIIGREAVQPTALQSLAQWAHQNQLAQPRVYVSVLAATQPKVVETWQKQFYASFCTSFAPAGSSCSSAAVLDQGALLFADGLESITTGLGTVKDATHLPTREQLVQKIKAAHFAGVSGPILFQGSSNLLLTNPKATPVLLSIQDDGSIQSAARL